MCFTFGIHNVRFGNDCFTCVVASCLLGTFKLLLAAIVQSGCFLFFIIFNPFLMTFNLFEVIDSSDHVPLSDCPRRYWYSIVMDEKLTHFTHSMQFEIYRLSTNRLFRWQTRNTSKSMLVVSRYTSTQRLFSCLPLLV